MAEWKTTDFYRVSYLKAYGIEPVERYIIKGTDKVRFVYRVTPELEQRLELYERKQDETPALALKSAQRDVKDWIYDEDNKEKEE
jgi:hypothetical protein